MSNEALFDTSVAVIAALLHALGADRDNPIEIDYPIIRDAIDGKYVVVAGVKAFKPLVYELWYKEERSTNHE